MNATVSSIRDQHIVAQGWGFTRLEGQLVATLPEGADAGLAAQAAAQRGLGNRPVMFLHDQQTRQLFAVEGVTGKRFIPVGARLTYKNENERLADLRLGQPDNVHHIGEVVFCAEPTLSSTAAYYVAALRGAAAAWLTPR